jgi:tetratricopeptide (TPR) repeat protein
MESPFRWAGGALQANDFSRLAPLFKRVVRQQLACDTVRLEPLPVEATDPGVSGCMRDEVAARPVVDPVGPFLTLPLWAGDHLLGSTTVRGGDPSLYGGRSQEWLRERGRIIVRELQLIKELAIDPVTGLANGAAFLARLQEEMEASHLDPDVGGKAGYQLLLLEIHSGSRKAEENLLTITRIASHLEAMIGIGAPLHHLGAGIFAQLLPSSPEEARGIGDGILRWLKREKIPRGHLGLIAVPARRAVNGQGHAQAAEEIVEQGWQALKTARRRGPHALYSAGSTPAMEASFKNALPGMVSELKKRWRKAEKFALLLIEQDQEGEVADLPDLPAMVSPLAGPDGLVLPLSGREAYVLMPEAGEDEVKKRIEECKKKLVAMPMTFSAGIAFFPCARYKKADMPVNARKALRHARFFGSNSIAVFDSISLNISGDIYYEEGDLTRAMQEYRRGLALAAGSVNLLNSLGVACAQIARYRKAVHLFERALAIDPDNLMALFNLGHAYLALEDEAKAVDCFTRALALDNRHFELLLQLGKLYCQAGRFEEAVSLLAKAEQLGVPGEDSAGHGRAHYFRGQAEYGLGRNQQAIIHLQKALKHNPRDGGAISLLGELYARERQGDEIALSLCRQALELDDTRSDHWYRLGVVHWYRGEEREAVDVLRQCLRRDRKNLGALRLLGTILESLGRLSQARLINQRLLKLRPEEKLDAAGWPDRIKIHEKSNLQGLIDA